MRRLLAASAALLVLAGCSAGPERPAQDPPGPSAPPAEPAPPPPPPAAPPSTVPPPPPPTESVGPPERSRSRALGLPFRRGRLIGGVPFPRAGIDHFTWDPVYDRSPNRLWRRYGTDRTVARTLAALRAFREAYPESPPVGVGDLSRPSGGDFGRRFGGLGHASHQNGLDVDVYYPRLDRQLVAATRPDQVDRVLAQGLVDAFVDAGAVSVFVGPSLRLRGPRGVVSALRHHDDHLHARFPR
ncbi:MAG TPA: penicillin-insensitive murein endopeptidase [Solirubrobacteraceae bacterium]|nr:penicillin-insensitive murein endopeptidase [Solirubrobacteraceae bacterium]